MVVFRERLQIEVDSMREVKVSAASFQQKGSQLFILHVLLDHHISNYLGNVVLEVVSLLSSVNDRVNSFFGE